MKMPKPIFHVRTFGSRLLLIPLTILTLLTSSGTQCRAATRTWDGSSANNNWSLGSNWVEGTPPSNGDDLVFGQAGAVNKLSDNDLLTFVARSITFTDSGYTLIGNGITLSGTNGINVTVASGSNAITSPLFAGTNTTFNVANSGARLGLSGTLSLPGFDLTTAGNGFLNLAGLVSGSGGIIKIGTGTNRLSGASANTFTGGFSISSGTLELAKSGNVNSIPTELTIGAGATVRHLSPHGIADSATVTINGSSSMSGTLNLNGFNDTIGPLTLAGGEVFTGTGTMTLAGDITASAVGAFPANPSQISGNLSLGNALRTINVANNIVANPDFTIQAQISSGTNGGFVKIGIGQMRLSSANTYQGQTIISNGLVYASAATCLGGSEIGTILAGGTLMLDGVTIASEPLTNNSPNSDLQMLEADTAGWSGAIVLNADLNLFVQTNGTMTLSGIISGSGGMVKGQPGITVLSGAAGNTFSGALNVVDGQVHLNKSSGTAVQTTLILGDGTGADRSAEARLLANSQIADAASVSILSDGFLNVSTFADVIGPITMNQGHIQTVTNGLLTLNGDLTTLAAPGRILHQWPFVFGQCEPHV